MTTAKNVDSTISNSEVVKIRSKRGIKSKVSLTAESMKKDPVKIKSRKVSGEKFSFSSEDGKSEVSVEHMIREFTTRATTLPESINILKDTAMRTTLRTTVKPVRMTTRKIVVKPSEKAEVEDDAKVTEQNNGKKEVEPTSEQSNRRQSGKQKTKETITTEMKTQNKTSDIRKKKGRGNIEKKLSNYNTTTETPSGEKKKNLRSRDTEGKKSVILLDKVESPKFSLL